MSLDHPESLIWPDCCCCFGQCFCYAGCRPSHDSIHRSKAMKHQSTNSIGIILQIFYPIILTMGLCKIDSWIWTIFSFVLHMMTWWSVLVMVPTVFDKTQAWARKSIFCLKSYKNVVVNHLELIRDKLKILFGAENSGLKWG